MTEYDNLANLEYSRQAIANLSKGGAYESPLREYGSTILLLTSPEDELHDFEMDLRGMQENEHGQMVRVEEPLVNDKGVAAILRAVKPQTNRLNILSNYEKARIEKKLMSSSDALIKDLMLNRSKYGIKRECADSDRTRIVLSATDYTEPSLLRGQDAGERKFLGKTHQQQDVNVHNQSQKQGGLMTKFMGWNR